MSVTCVCPSCGGAVLFKSRFSTFATCSYCQSMLICEDQEVAGLGKAATLAPDMSPLQIGVQGKFDRADFELVGRIRLSWSEGNWNEWYVMFCDGRDGWLAEAQGVYAVSFEHRDAAAIPQLGNLKVGSTWRFEDNAYEVDDIKMITCTGSEGELPFRGVKGRKSTSVDLSGWGQRFAALDYAEERTALYLGRYVEFTHLSLTGLRDLDGW